MKFPWSPLLCLFAASPALAASPGIRPFLDQHCIECHDGEVKKGGLDLTSLSTEASDAAAHKRWVRVYDRVLAGEMPPAKRERPEATTLQAFAKALGTELKTAHATQKGTVLRRLNRREYEHTLHDLLGIQTDLMSRLPEDGRARGFDNIGEALSISGVQMQRYMEAAELALNETLSAYAKPESTVQTATLESSERNKETIGKHWLKRADGSVVVFNFGGFPSTVIPNLRAKTTGTYKLRVTGYGYQISEPVVFAVLTGSFNFRNTDTITRSYHELPVDKPGTVETTLSLPATHGIWISAQGLNGPDGHSPIKDGPDKYPGEGLALMKVELEGPLPVTWPPRGQKLLLGEAKLRQLPHGLPPSQAWRAKEPSFKHKYTADSANPTGDARRNLSAFITAAFRRPTTEAETEPYMKLFEAEYASSQDFLQAMRTAAIAVLCSPEFLYLKEPAGKLTDHALATRLSYFLTRSAPDATLLDLAAGGKLGQATVLREQTARLLQAATAERFINDFTDGWLNLRDIEFTTPDKQLFPEFDGLLQDSMLRETRAFISTLIRENLSSRLLIQSDFAMLNARLAKHYGIAGVSGLEIRKVPLPPDSKRGGVLTQASILKVSANGTNTSPVVRGVWVMDRLLGDEPPPPPPGVPGVEPDTRGAKTMREILDKHRSLETCNGCHRVIDPPGFALESYDVIGGWRERFRSLGEGERVQLKIEGRNVRYKLGPPVDASGELPSGEKFTSITEFQKLLLTSEDRVARCLIERLLTFATGREMGFSDREEIERLVASSKARGHAIRDLIHAVVQSDIFSSE